MSKQTLKVSSALALAMLFGTAAYADESRQELNRTGAPIHKCYHSGNAYCRAQMQQQERAQFNRRLARTKGIACATEQVAKATPKNGTGQSTVAAASP